jgi:hypothetical protein
MTTFFTILGVMWSIGWVALAIWAAAFLIAEGEWVPGILAALIGFPIAIFVALLPWAIAQDIASPDLATLKKGEWACSATRTETTMMPITSGKTTTMVPTTRSVCTAYVRTG